jgi:hypothetical protein
MKNILNKKAQLNGLFVGIVTIVTIGLLLTIMLYVFPTIGDSMRTANTAGTVVNESITGLNSTVGDSLSKATLNDVVCTLTGLINKTSSVAIATANATITNCILYGTAAGGYDGANVNVSYSYVYSMDTAASNATDTMITQFVAFLPWLGIILLVLAAGVVLFFVIRSFGGAGKGV